MLTFDQFQATANPATIEDAASRIGCDIDQLNNISRVWFYEDFSLGECYLLELPGGAFHCVIYNQEWTGTRADMEAVLYREFYLPEICGVTDSGE